MEDRWPHRISEAAFRQSFNLEGEAFWMMVFDTHRDKMQIKNPKVAVANLEKIFTAAFRLSNSKGFQAMSLRDLSAETGISMGGLYAYIGSKNDLASVIEGVLRQIIDDAMGDLASQNLDPLTRLRAIVFGEIYMMDCLSPWFYFCFMELKGLDREQQQQAMDLELRFEAGLIDAIQAGMEQEVLHCESPALQASLVTAQLQQWHLKKWKFRLRQITAEEYASAIFDNLCASLQVDDSSLASLHSPQTVGVA